MLDAESTCCAIPPGFSLSSLSDVALKGHATPKAPVGAFAFQVKTCVCVCVVPLVTNPNHHVELRDFSARDLYISRLAASHPCMIIDSGDRSNFREGGCGLESCRGAFIHFDGGERGAT